MAQYHNLELRGESAYVPLGVSSEPLHRPNGVDGHRWAGQMIGGVIGRAEADWYVKTAEDIRSQPALVFLFEQVHEQLQQGISLEEVIRETKRKMPDMESVKLQDRLLMQFFFGKEGLRTNQRQERILKEIFPPNSTPLEQKHNSK